MNAISELEKIVRVRFTKSMEIKIHALLHRFLLDNQRTMYSKSMRSSDKNKVSLHQILVVISEYLHLPINEITKVCRKRDVITARMYYYHLARKYTTHSMGVIGRMVNKLDHATIIHALNTCRDLIDTDLEFQNNIISLENIIYEQYLRTPDNGYEEPRKDWDEEV